MCIRDRPRSAFQGMAFDKKDTFELVNSMKKLDFRSRIQEITCPVLVICGEKEMCIRDRRCGGKL